jgi:hypothetical protein
MFCHSCGFPFRAQFLLPSFCFIVFLIVHFACYSLNLADLFLLRFVVEIIRSFFSPSALWHLLIIMCHLPPRSGVSFTISAYEHHCFLTGYACQALHLQHFLSAAGWGCSLDRAESLAVQKFVFNRYISVKGNYFLVIFIQHTRTMPAWRLEFILFSKVDVC